MSIHAFRYREIHVEVDRRGQTLHLDVSDAGTPEECPDEPSASPDGAWDFNTGVHYEAPLYASVAQAPLRAGFVPFAAFAEKARIFDQGLQAALEVLAHEGTVGLPGRRALLRLLSQQIDFEDPARALVDAAQVVAGDTLPVVKVARDRAEALLATFYASPTWYRPQAWYTWDDRLPVVHDFDRLLRAHLDEGTAGTLARLFADEPSAADHYQRHLDLNACIAGRSAVCDLFGHGPMHCETRALFPQPMWPEQHLVEALFDARTPNEPLGMAIDRDPPLRLDDQPGGFDGLVRQQLHALAPLLAPQRYPEAARLRHATSYRVALREAFKGWSGVTGHAPIKVLEAQARRAPTAGVLSVPVGPALTVEPLAECYRRRAAGYRRIREGLMALLGRAPLEAAVRVRPRTAVANDLLYELVEMELLFLGAYLVACHEVGLAPAADGYTAFEHDAAVARLRGWLRRWRSDADLAEDVRSMIPCGIDPDRGTVRVHAVLGLTVRELTARFEVPPQVRMLDATMEVIEGATPSFLPQTAPVANLAVVACDVRKVLDAQAFRALCDQEVTVARIAGALGRL